MTRGVVFRALCCVMVSAAVGCSGVSKRSATVRFEREITPSTPLSEQYMTIAVMNAQVGGDTDQFDQSKWAELTAQMIQGRLEDAGQQNNIPIKLVDREHLKLTMGEKDLAAAGVSDSGDALASAQVQGAKAILTSKVTVKVDKQAKSKRTIDAGSIAAAAFSQSPGSVRSEEVKEEARTITVSCQFQLKDAATNDIIVSYNGQPMQDSTQTSASRFSGRNMTEADMTPRDKVIGGMVEQQAQVFLAKFIPVKMTDETTFESSRNEHSVAGVNAINAEDYEAALASFKQAIAVDPDDDASLFGAGVCCEKLNRFDEARKYYKQAFSIEADNAEYAKAVNRVS